MRDEAEIRGHRRTYIGALPGQVIQGLRRAESKNPVFILDEIDKLGSDFRGDPASALLEVLDPEQNNSFRDHYLDVPFDLSEVLFLTTANVLDPVPPALRDRMEVLELAGYTEEEKLQDCLRAPDREAGQEPRPDAGAGASSPSRRSDRSSADYTREAGVRNLEREIGALCRKVARRRAEGDDTPTSSSPPIPSSRCSARRRSSTKRSRTGPRIRAWPSAWPGRPPAAKCCSSKRRACRAPARLTLTGHLGDVMKESARTALSWFRAHAQHYGVDPTFYKDSEIHLHVPSGRYPQGRPSAGVTMVSALASQLTGRPVRGDIAMTGEITLSGRVLPGRRHQGKGAGGATPRHHRDHHAAAERKERQGGSDRRCFARS